MSALDANYRRSLREAALRIANRCRREMGLPPVKHLYKGRRGDPNSCAISETIRDDDANDWSISTGRTYITIGKGDRNIAVRHTELSQQFINEFDLGMFPRLEN
jgi:hypothetical protein